MQYYGTPWTTACDYNEDENHSVWSLQAGAWVEMQPDIASQIAVSPSGVPWAVNNSGTILVWSGGEFVVSSAGGCGLQIAVGPNAYGLTNGTPWVIGCDSNLDGNHSVWQMQTNGGWHRMGQNDIATQIAISPDHGVAWAINAVGNIFYFNGSTWVPNPTGGCGVSIAVGPTNYSANGVPWVTGCDRTPSGNDSVWEMQIGENQWQEVYGELGVQIAVSPDAGYAWVLAMLANGQKPH